MAIRLGVAVLLAVVLAGCSSGEVRFGTGFPTVGDRSQIVRQFADGSGIVSLAVTRADEPTVATAFASDTLRAPPEAAAPAIRDVRLAATHPFGNTFTGTAVINGTPVAVTTYRDFVGQTAIHRIAGARDTLLVAGGRPVQDIPRGAFTYQGANVIGNADGTGIEQGTFTMDVNFDTRRAVLSGSTPNTAISDSRVGVNTASGTFASSNMTINAGGEVLSGSIHGRFHGDGAVGVTGIYHDNARTPALAGAIAGTR